MGEKFFPFDSVNADRVYRAEDFASFFGDVITPAFLSPPRTLSL